MEKKLDIKISVGSLLKFSAPSIIMMLVMSLYTVVDGIFVARLVNTDAFSAVNIVYPLPSLIVAFGTMFGSGLVPIVSKKLGENRKREANEIMTFVTLFALGLSAALTAVSLIFLDPIIKLLGANEAIEGYARDYALPLICFFPASMLQLMFGCLIIADGKPNMGLAATMAGGAANIVLDYVFIELCGMGIAGAAVATGIGYSIPALTGVIYFSFHRKGSLCFVKPRAAFRQLVKTVTNGSSEMVSNLSMSVTTLLFNLVMMKAMGQKGVAAITVVMYLDFVLTSASLGYSMGVAPLIGYNYGADNKEKQRAIFKLSVIFSVAVGVITTVLTVFFGDYLVNIFTDRSDPVFAIAAQGLVIFSIAYLFKGYNIYCSAMFTAYSNGLISAVVSVLRSLVFLVVSLLSLTAIFGIGGVWYSVPLAELLTLAFSIFFTVKYGRRYGYLGKASRPIV